MPELVCSADDPRWHAERRAGVTATDITAIIGISPYDSAYSLYHKKTGAIPDGQPDGDRLRLGRYLEPLITQRWFEQNDQSIYTGAQLWRSTERPWQMATPDGVLGVSLSQISAVLECKSWADADRHAWDDGPPPRVRAQVLWQMDTLDVPTGHVGVLFLPSGEFRSYVIDHTDCAGPIRCDVHEDIDLMRLAGAEFWLRFSNPGKYPPPDVDGSSASLAALRARFPASKGKEAEIDAAVWDTWANARARADTWLDIAKLEEAKIREQLGEATILTVGGTKVATRITGDAQVKAHVRHNDYIRRTPKKGDSA